MEPAGSAHGERSALQNCLSPTPSEPPLIPPQFTVRLTDRVLRPTVVFDTYWRFATTRQAIYIARLHRDPLPWTGDSVLQLHRFTNVFRAADRVSQFLINEVQRATSGALEPADVV